MFTWLAGARVRVPGVGAYAVKRANFVFGTRVGSGASIADPLFNGGSHPSILLVVQSDILTRPKRDH